MRVVFKNIADTIIDAHTKAQEDGREIERIELSRSEATALREELKGIYKPIPAPGFFGQLDGIDLYVDP